MQSQPETRKHRTYPNSVWIMAVPSEYGTHYRFEAPTHVGREFEDEKLAELYADVYFDVNSFREEKSGDRGVPPEIAAAGKDTLAAYLVTNPGMSVSWVSQFMDVGEDTIRTYLSRVRKRAEEIREEIDDDDDQDDEPLDEPNREPDPEPVDESNRETNSAEEPPEVAVDAIVNELDLPGSGGALEERRDAVRACWRYLREQGEATKSDFVADIYPDYTARYGSSGGWWNAVGKQGLREVADAHESVDAPAEGNHVWVFVE